MLLAVVVPVLTYQTPPGTEFSLGDFLVDSLVGMAHMALLLTVVMIAFLVMMLFAVGQRGVIGEHVIEIREEGLMEKTSVNESLHRWNGLHKITTSRAALFVYVSGFHFHYIPFRAFPSKEEAMRFETELRRRVNAAQGP